MRRAQISDGPNWPLKFFTPDELRCKGSGRLEIDLISGLALDELRQMVDRPLHIVSAYRSPDHNRAVGGANNSYHLQGMAFDIAAMSAQHKMQLISAATLCGFKGFGWYKTFLHVDMGSRRFWFDTDAP